MNNVINTAEFIQTLKREGLIIVSIAELDRMSFKKQNQKRDMLLARKSLTLLEIIKLDILPIKTKQGIRSWIETGKILQSEVSTSFDGKIKIKTSFLKRLGYVD